jgi:hypothetical protein
MTERKLASVAPRYRQPSSYNPFTGKYAILGREGILSRCAMMQIVGDDETEANEDTHDDYVFCRGYDPESEKFYNKIAVAKPYGVRGTFPYKLAEVYPAIKPMTLLGDTAMVAATTTGQPASLTEELDILYEDAPDNDHPIWWLLLDAGGGVRFVKVEKDGGVAGNASTDCTWTYTVKTLGDVTMETTISPEQERYPKTTYLEAAASGRSEYALAEYVSGTLKLIWVPGEIADTSTCP